MSKPNIGDRFGRRIILSVFKKGREFRCVSRCDCGTINEVGFYSMKRSVSCGCLSNELHRKRLTIHGGKKTKMYGLYSMMIARCENPNIKSYHRYGGRGINVCSRWRHSFESFLSDMGERPSDKHQLDRINNDGNYEPENCEWTTAVENSRKRRTTRITMEIARCIRDMRHLGARIRTIADLLQVSDTCVAMVSRSATWREQNEDNQQPITCTSMDQGSREPDFQI